MKKTTRRTAGISALSLLTKVSLQAPAQSLTEKWPGAYPNGVYWKSLSDEGKLCFAIGMSDGMTYMFNLMPNAKHKIVEKEDKELMDSIVGRSYSDTTKRVDGLYNDPSNTHIPVWEMVILANRANNGAIDQKSLGTELANKRSKYTG